MKDLGGSAREGDGLVDLWPDREAKRHRPLLVMRLIVVHGGRHPASLVAPVLVEVALWDSRTDNLVEVRRHSTVESSCSLGTLKQTFERRKLPAACYGGPC